MNFILYRMVGGFIGLGPNKTTECRLRFALGVALYMAFAAAIHHAELFHITAIFITTFAAAFLGRLIGHSPFQSGTAWWQILGMSWIGLARLSMIIFPYAFLLHGSAIWLDTQIISVALFGLLQGPAYYFGWQLDGRDSGIYFRNAPQQWRIKTTAGVPINLVTALPMGVTLAVSSGEVPSIDAEPGFLDQGAVGGGEWGELFTGIFAYNLPYLVLLVLP